MKKLAIIALASFDTFCSLMFLCALYVNLYSSLAFCLSFSISLSLLPANLKLAADEEMIKPSGLCNGIKSIVNIFLFNDI